LIVNEIHSATATIKPKLGGLPMIDGIPGETLNFEKIAEEFDRKDACVSSNLCYSQPDAASDRVNGSNKAFDPGPSGTSRKGGQDEPGEAAKAKNYSDARQATCST
jgi:hypothetical protein